jgi:hypothetical protein
MSADLIWGDPQDVVVELDRDTVIAQLRMALYGTRPAWMNNAACKGSTLDFTSKAAKVASQCLQVCGRCDVLSECRAWADEVGDVHAVLGGETPAARRARLKLKGKRGRAHAN